MKILLCITSALIALSGCAIGLKYLPEDKSPATQTFYFSFDETWVKIINTLSKRNSSIKTLEKASGIVSIEGADTIKANVSERIKGNLHKYIRCIGDADMHVNHKLFGKANIFSKKINEESTKVDITTSYNVTAYDAFNKRPVELTCVSSGIFEQEIYNGILSNDLK